MPERHSGGLASYPAAFLDCRELHDWHWLTDHRILRNRAGVIVEWSRTRSCRRCGTERVTRYDAATGRPITGRYVYVDGYLAERGEPITSAAARLEALHRLLADPTRADLITVTEETHP